MAISRVDFGGQTLIDLTNDSVTSASLLAGFTAHGANGEPILGAAAGGQSVIVTNGETEEEVVLTNITYSTEDLESGVSELDAGQLYIVYEENDAINSAPYADVSKHVEDGKITLYFAGCTLTNMVNAIKDVLSENEIKFPTAASIVPRYGSSWMFITYISVSNSTTEIYWASVGTGGGTPTLAYTITKSNSGDVTATRGTPGNLDSANMYGQLDFII